MASFDARSLLRDGVIDARSLALLWLLSEGGVPLVVAGPAPAAERQTLAVALLSLDPARPWVLLDADQDAVDAQRLAALLRGGSALGLTLAADDLEAVIERLVNGGLPEDGVRRLGVVVIAGDVAGGLRCTVTHYLRPTERDAQGHVQRRPPAVLAAWDEGDDVFEDYAWGITPELADRVGRSQADLEERLADRERFLASLLDDEGPLGARVAAYLGSEPAPVPAPLRADAEPSPFKGGLLDADEHGH
jgi:hypothetical protein